METFFTFLEKRVQDCSSLLCVGLDPHAAELPESNASAALDYCLKIIRSTAPYAAAFKPNAAFFEALGPEGWEALSQVIEAIAEESNRLGSMVPVILDAKRGDIASTAEAYAHSAFKKLCAHAITLSPYLGRDAIEPFLTDQEKGVFLLCKTSNPGSGDIQDLILEDGRLVYEYVAKLAQSWNVRGNLGLVVGATHPAALARLRDIAPGLWFLVPGIGAQGGDLEITLQAGLRQDGMGLLINVSRGIARTADPGKAARDLRDEMINIQYAFRDKQHLQRDISPIYGTRLAHMADGLLESGCVKFGDFTLKSGMQSPIYIDLRQLVSFPRLLADVASAYFPLLKKLAFDRLAALPYAAIPIATSISIQGGWPLLYPRKEAKTYGTKADIEGLYLPGERVVVIDDLATTGSSKFEAIDKLTAAGLEVTDVVVLIDRQSGASQALEQGGYRLHAVFTLTGLLEHWEKTGKVSIDLIRSAREFIENSTG